MKAVVVYESMYGNTHEIAAAIGEGLAASFDVAVVARTDADDALVRGADLLVVGGPTHVHGMSRPSTRKAAVEQAAKDDGNVLELEPDAQEDGIREWLAALGELDVAAAAFDTRIDAAPALTGHASHGIAKRLRKHGCRLVAEPESFLVDKHSHLLHGEHERAVQWAGRLVEATSTAR